MIRTFTGEEFVDHYDSQGWLGGNGIPIRDWKAKARSWERKPPAKRGSTGSKLSVGELSMQERI